MQETSDEQAFIDEVAPGAIATQARYGVPAAVTIAQAIDESGWGQSVLATQDNNLFGMKGTGPAGSDLQPTQEYENGEWITISAPFRVYDSFSQSIDDHGALLATSGYYTQAMADRNDPDAFANALTGVYATNPDYGSDLVQLMQQYDLYRYDAAAPSTAGTVDGAQAKPDAHAAHGAADSRGATSTKVPTAATPGRNIPSPRQSPAGTGPSPSPERSPARTVRPPVKPSPSPTPRPPTPRPVTRTPSPAPSPSGTVRPGTVGQGGAPGCGVAPGVQVAGFGIARGLGYEPQ